MSRKGSIHRLSPDMVMDEPSRARPLTSPSTSIVAENQSSNSAIFSNRPPPSCQNVRRSPKSLGSNPQSGTPPPPLQSSPSISLKTLHPHTHKITSAPALNPHPRRNSRRTPRRTSAFPTHTRTYPHPSRSNSPLRNCPTICAPQSARDGRPLERA